VMRAPGRHPPGRAGGGRLASLHGGILLQRMSGSLRIQVG
jgi:hypothetical protein